MHTNLNARHVNQERVNPQGHGEAQADRDGSVDGHSNVLANHQCPVAQRIEHPHLTGMGSLLSWICYLSNKSHSASM
jgi:hypothetical protein